MRRHIGIYSGSFDPIHLGHVAFAKKSVEQCNLDQVIFLPEPKPREKNSVTPINKRLKDINIAIADDPNLSSLAPMSDQFNVKSTLPELKKIFPNTSFTFLVGSDVVRTFSYRWKDLEMLFKNVALAIGMRDGDSEVDIINIISDLQKKYKLKINYSLVYTPHSHLASSKINR